MTTNNQAKVAVMLLSKLAETKIVVGCVTCNTFFLNMKWNEYIPLLNGDLATPTKWYNNVALHYCQNPTHIILSNRNPMGLNNQFNFTETLNDQLRLSGVSLAEFTRAVMEIRKTTENLPV